MSNRQGSYKCQCSNTEQHIHYVSKQNFQHWDKLHSLYSHSGTKELINRFLCSYSDHLFRPNKVGVNNRFQTKYPTAICFQKTPTFKHFPINIHVISFWI